MRRGLVGLCVYVCVCEWTRLALLLIKYPLDYEDHSWEASPFHLCTHIVLILHTQRCSINACPTLFPGVSPPTPAALLELGSPRGDVRKAELASPAAVTSRGWRRAQATGSSGTRAAPPSPSRSAPGRTPSVPCDGTSACGKRQSHQSRPLLGHLTVDQGRRGPEGAPPQACSATAAGQEDTETLCLGQRERVATPVATEAPTSFQSSNNSV